MNHPALQKIRAATAGTEFEGRLWLVGGCVRDELLGLPMGSDIDIVTELSADALAQYLFGAGICDATPATFERFGTAMVRIAGLQIEIATSRAESYAPDTRKPNVVAAPLDQDALRRDFTVNALMRNLDSGELRDDVGGEADLRAGLLRTPLDPAQTFSDDPLRMLRAVRFRNRLGFAYAPGLEDAIRAQAHRLSIISVERIREEFTKMLVGPAADQSLRDLLDLGLLAEFALELVAMVGVEQGRFHHLDVWEHTLLVVQKTDPDDLLLRLGALLHDVAKPATRMIDDKGQTRFFGHESLGADMARAFMQRLRFSHAQIDTVATLVANHMRLGSAPQLSASAARRLIRDLGEHLDRFLALVEADCQSIKPGLKTLDLPAIRERIASVQAVTPAEKLGSPLTGREIMDAFGLEPGPRLGEAKAHLVELVLAGELRPDDREAALDALRRWLA